MKTLVLSPWDSPFLIVRWQVGITMMLLEKADLVEPYGDEMCASPSITLPMPAVLRQRRHVSGFKRGVKFSQTNVFTRDRYTCQYCGERKPTNELNYDHVIPRSQGGKKTWTNIVTSCFPCNIRKANRTPDQAGMPLRCLPTRPLTLPLAALELDERSIPEPWVPYARKLA